MTKIMIITIRKVEVFMKSLYKGLIITLAIAIISMLLNAYILPFIETLTIGIILGIFVANFYTLPADYDLGITFALKKILKWGIVLLGVKLNFALFISLGPMIALLIVFMITLALVSASYIGKHYKLPPKLAILLGVGSSICGASAIVAMGPAIQAEEEETAIAVTVISLLGAIGVIIYSFAAKYLPLTDMQYGIWSGISLQGVAHALAAAGARGSDNLSLEIGTLVKMARVACLGPVAIVLQRKFAVQNSNQRLKMPRYVLNFILVGCLFTVNAYYNIFPTVFSIDTIEVDLISSIKSLSNLFILMAMVAMGLKVNLKSMRSDALNALKVCSIVFAVLSITSFVLLQGL